MRLREQKHLVQSHVLWVQDDHQAPDPSFPASNLSSVKTLGDQGTGRFVLPEREERKTLKWGPVKERWGGQAEEGKSIPGKGNSTCKGTVAGKSTAWWEEAAIPWG